MNPRLILVPLLISAAVASAAAWAQDKGSVDPKPLPPLANLNDPKLGAKELFGRKVLPAAMPTRVIGFYAKGCIAGADALPINGETWQVMRLSRNRNWAHPAMVALLKRLAAEGKTFADFDEQKKNRWKLQGKSFLDIFKDVYGDEHTAKVNEHMYRCSFGIMSESVHCSWNDSMDWCLQRKEDGTFSIYPFFHPADIRYITPLLPFCNESYALWLKRIEDVRTKRLSCLDYI